MYQRLVNDTSLTMKELVLAKRQVKTLEQDLFMYKLSIGVAKLIASAENINVDDVTHQQVYDQLSKENRVWFYATFKEHIKNRRN